MKNISLLLIIMLCPVFLMAQNPDGDYNPYVNSGTINPAPLLPAELLGTGVISFNFGNSGSDPLEVYTNPDHRIKVTISLSLGEPNSVDPISAINGSAAGFFSWTYGNGTFEGTQTSVVPANSSGDIIIAYKVTDNSASPGSNGFNVNITPAPYQTTSNTQNDDAVSSYTYTTDLRDFGDAPVSYGSVSHTYDAEYYLGTLWDGEIADLTSAFADGDDSNGQDDEDGVVIPASILLGETVVIPVTVAGLGRLNAWIDWNGDGDFVDTGERIADNVIGSDETLNLSVIVPVNAVVSAPTFSRFRFSPGSLSSSEGSADGGEVEDYQINLACAPFVPTLSSSDEDNTFCAGDNIVFTSGGGINYEFRVDGGSIQNGPLDTFETGSLTNGQVVDVIVTDISGCSSSSAGITNTVNSMPIPTLSSSDGSAFCVETNVTFTAGGGISYEFRVDEQSVQNGSSEVYITNSLIDGQVVDVIVTNASACSVTSAEITNTVYDLPLVIVNDPAPVCSPETADLTQSTVTEGSAEDLIFTYWSDLARTITYETPASASSGTYFIMGTESLTGCFSISPVSVVVNETPSTPLVDVVDNCDGTSVLSTIASGELLWNTGASTPAIIVSTAGTYSITTTLNGCISVEGIGIAAPKIAPVSPIVSDAAPINICPLETIDLTSLVSSSPPVGGSTHYKTSDNPLGIDVSDPYSVGDGSYYIFYQDVKACYSNGTEVVVAINPCPPDLTPTLIVSPNIMHGITNFNLIVRVTELNSVETNGAIIVNIPKDLRWILSNGFDPSLSLLSGTNLNNIDWNYSSDPINHIFTSTMEIPEGGSSTIGLVITFDPGNTKGIFPITSQIVSGSGGEVRVNNNADSEKIDYFQE